MLKKIPARTESLGTLLDLTVEPTPHKRTRIDDWHGWHVVVPEDAFDRRAGAGAIFLVRSDVKQSRELGPDETHASGTYERWHKRAPKKMIVLDAADRTEKYLGRVTRIGYRSDKWGPRGKAHDYDHDFREDGGIPPKLYADKPNIAAATTARIVGGNFVITEAGIA